MLHLESSEKQINALNTNMIGLRETAFDVGLENCLVAGRGKGQACCDWQSDKLFDVGLCFAARPPLLRLPPTEFIFTVPPIFTSLQAV